MPDAPTTERFDLDHARVRALYTRTAGRYRGPLGDRITKFDLRLTQPNVQDIPTATQPRSNTCSPGRCAGTSTTP